MWLRRPGVLYPPPPPRFYEGEEADYCLIIVTVVFIVIILIPVWQCRGWCCDTDLLPCPSLWRKRQERGGWVFYIPPPRNHPNQTVIVKTWIGWQEHHCYRFWKWIISRQGGGGARGDMKIGRQRWQQRRWGHERGAGSVQRYLVKVWGGKRAAARLGMVLTLVGDKWEMGWARCL